MTRTYFVIERHHEGRGCTYLSRTGCWVNRQTKVTEFPTRKLAKEALDGLKLDEEILKSIRIITEVGEPDVGTIREKIRDLRSEYDSHTCGYASPEGSAPNPEDAKHARKRATAIFNRILKLAKEL